MSRTAAAEEIERDRRTYTRAKGSSFVQGVFYPEHARAFEELRTRSPKELADALPE